MGPSGLEVAYMESTQCANEVLRLGNEQHGGDAFGVYLAGRLVYLFGGLANRTRLLIHNRDIPTRIVFHETIKALNNSRVC